MKGAYAGKFTKLEFLKNLTLGPKFYLQSVYIDIYFSQKTIYCAIVELMIKNAIVFVDHA